MTWRRRCHGLKPPVQLPEEPQRGWRPCVARRALSRSPSSCPPSLSGQRPRAPTACPLLAPRCEAGLQLGGYLMRHQSPNEAAANRRCPEEPSVVGGTRAPVIASPIARDRCDSRCESNPESNPASASGPRPPASPPPAVTRLTAATHPARTLGRASASPRRTCTAPSSTSSSSTSRRRAARDKSAQALPRHLGALRR